VSTPRLFLVGAWVWACLAGPGQAGEFVLVENGSNPAPVVVSKNAPPRTRAAAGELIDYIEKISGARPELIEGEPKSIPPRAVWVGAQPAARKLLPRLDLAFQHPEEILLACDGRHLVIAGRDRWDPQHMDVQARDGIVKGKQQEYGTINAVYTFLQDKLEVRWLWPDELGEDVPKRPTIRLAPFEYRYHPQIRSRGGLLHFSSLGNKGYGRAHDWARLQRLQLHSLDLDGGHGFADWWDRYSKTHPEIFALQPDGTRTGFASARTAKLCQSNPKVWELWLKGVEDQLAKDPTRTVFNASPNDGWASGHCVCEKCSAWDHPDGEKRLFIWRGHRAERPALSDRDVTFANRLAGLLQQRYPGKDYRVLMNSYGHSRPAPVAARPADNVIISSVANFLGRTGLVDRGSTTGQTYRQQFDAWARLGCRMMWRPNTGSPGGWQQGLPDLTISQTAQDLQHVAASGCVGIFVDSVWEHWATQGPQYYVMAQLAWDPRQDPAALLADYYRRGFGPAADAVRAYFELWEQARSAYVAQYGHEAGLFSLPRLYAPQRLAQAQAHLDQAAKAAAAGAEIYRRRVEFVRAGLAYTRLQTQNATLMLRYWLKPDDAIAAQVRKNWQAIETLCREHPYALSWGPLRPGTDRMLGLHPEHPNPKIKPKQLRELGME